jgi:hypothetical protein
MLRPRFAVVAAAGVFAAPRAARGAAAPREALAVTPRDADPVAERAEPPAARELEGRDDEAVAGVFFFVGALPLVSERTIFAMPR